jgi:hypothetical protein
MWYTHYKDLKPAEPTSETVSRIALAKPVLHLYPTWWCRNPTALLPAITEPELALHVHKTATLWKTDKWLMLYLYLHLEPERAWIRSWGPQVPPNGFLERMKGLLVPDVNDTAKWVKYWVMWYGDKL